MSEYDELVNKLIGAAGPNQTGTLLIDSANAIQSLQARVKELEADAATFHMNYRMKCDEETKALEIKIMELRNATKELLKCAELEAKAYFSAKVATENFSHSLEESRDYENAAFLASAAADRVKELLVQP